MEVCVQCPYCLNPSIITLVVGSLVPLVDVVCCHCGKHIKGHVKVDI